MQNGFSFTQVIQLYFFSVQSLAPVQNIIAKPSNFSVHLSWTIPSSVISTYVTYFIIYLNGTEINKISRAYYGNQNTLRDLKPYTNYVVGIKTQDGYLMDAQSTVYKNFKTTEAGKYAALDNTYSEFNFLNKLMQTLFLFSTIA